MLFTHLLEAMTNLIKIVILIFGTNLIYMKKLLLSVSVLISFGVLSQTTIFQEDFETGGATFNLNTTDMGGLNLENTWMINNEYAGGVASYFCVSNFYGIGFPNTDDQPAGITNFPNSSYMHIGSDAGWASGITSANYVAGDGMCTFDWSSFSAMANDISTAGMSDVTLDFWWLCDGSAQAYGEVYYSLDAGVTWVLKQSTYNSTTAWAQESLTDVAWANVGAIRFGFRFNNDIAIQGTVGGGLSFGVDDILISGTPLSISTPTMSQSSWCYGTAVTDAIDFNTAGTYNVGNVYTAEMSDALGSFASPTNVGTLSSSASGALTIDIAILGSMPAGNAYRIRAVSSDPSIIGADNGSDIIIYDAPTVTLGNFTDVCVYTPLFTLTGGTPTGGAYSGTGVAAGSFDPAGAGVGTHAITYTYVDGNSCSNTDVQNIVVDDCASINELEGGNLVVYPNPTNESFTILYDGDIEQVQLLDIHGREVKSFSGNEAIFDIQDVPAGIYLLMIESGTKKAVIRLTKE